MTKLLYLKLISLFCIFTFCKNVTTQATEISPIIGVGQENFTFEVSEFDPTNKGKKINFEPNVAGIMRLGLDAFGFGIGYSLRGTKKAEDLQKGNTNFSDWQIGYNSKHWGIETFYQTYEGFYTANTNVIQVHPNLSFRHVGITARYAIGSEDFAVGTLMDQSIDFKDTSGKYYLLAGYDEHDFSSDSSILQQENSGINAEIENLRKLKSSDVKFGFGAGKYWVFSNVFFIGGMIDFLATYANYKFESTTGYNTESGNTLSINARAGLGYKENNFRLGISLATDSVTLKTPDKGFLKPSANKILLYWRYFFNF